MNINIPKNNFTNLFIANSDEAQEKRRVKFNRIITAVLFVILCACISFVDLLAAGFASFMALSAYKFSDWIYVLNVDNKEPSIFIALIIAVCIFCGFILLPEALMSEKFTLWPLTKGYVILALIVSAGICLKRIYIAAQKVRKNYIETGFK